MDTLNNQKFIALKSFVVHFEAKVAKDQMGKSKTQIHIQTKITLILVFNTNLFC